MGGMGSIPDKTQQKITKWTSHRPFIDQVPSRNFHNIQSPTSPHQVFDDHLRPFGTPLPVVDHTHFLRVRIQNTQHSFNL